MAPPILKLGGFHFGSDFNFERGVCVSSRQHSGHDDQLVSDELRWRCSQHLLLFLCPRVRRHALHHRLNAVLFIPGFDFDAVSRGLFGRQAREKEPRGEARALEGEH